MANMSSATGIFEISQDIISDKEGRKHITNFFKYTQKYLSQCDYCTCLLMDMEEIVNEFDRAIEFGYDPELEFDGAGRWSYMYNIENYFSWLLEEISQDEKTAFVEMCKYLSESSPIVMRYVDVEPGMHLYEGHQLELSPRLLDENKVDTVIRKIS